MCITFFCFLPKTGQSQQIELAIGFNRDERSQRQAIEFGPFPEDPNIYAGRDKKSGGTWLGINIKTGILVFLTNLNQDQLRKGLSKGQLVKSFLLTSFVGKQDDNLSIDNKIFQRLKKVVVKGEEYPPFNLVVYHLRTSMCFFINSEQTQKNPSILERNKIYGLENTLPQIVEPRIIHGVNLFQKKLQKLDEKNDEEIIENIEEVMKDKQRFSDDFRGSSSIHLKEFFDEKVMEMAKTKSTFIGVFRREKESIRASIKEISFENEGETIVQEIFLI